MHIIVNNEDIALGTRDHVAECPIARATRRALDVNGESYDSVSVWSTGMSIDYISNDQEEPSEYDEVYYELPHVAQVFIDKYDSSEIDSTPAPIAFDI